ncbi:MAG: bifunctional 3-deoxy-7-phosphoheptulonate synthase/chorismate mutase type II [Bacteroidetes bacterium]|nr:bifunctional 3-deoxy-7-phosphoheptulonate synthase/chorismate mutase type II [Bacteroidota bacterium]MCL1968940.1 bifunctional 3-deoxy-7-phosphoheptulonate synthase/chorismate mutase type II [Bacteroidota bacterium]
MNTQKILIAGPCAAESQKQLYKTAKALFEFNTVHANHFDFQYFRCGIWKARTNPGDFQGVGDTAFEWLKEIKEQFGFKICVEVASKEHASLCIRNNTDAIWVGARTTVNPFIVQEIADAVQHSSLTVLVKNPVNPDINLWAGAIRRFQNAGIKSVMAVHRGFSVENENVYRNAPCWEIPVALKMKLPDIPVLCDIAHIAGNVSLQQNVAQTAVNYGFDGLMAEVHYAPEKALSDSKQQLLPSQFAHLLENITLPDAGNLAERELFIQRNLIKNIDIQISKLLSKRMEVVDEIATIKAKHALPVLQPNQWKKVVEIYEENMLKDENYRQFLEEFLLLLHKSSLKRQE